MQKERVSDVVCLLMKVGEKSEFCLSNPYCKNGWMLRENSDEYSRLIVHEFSLTYTMSIPMHVLRLQALLLGCMIERLYLII